MGVVQKAFVILLSMNLFLYFYIPTDWDVDSTSVLSSFIDVSGSTAQVGDNLRDTIPSDVSSDTASIGEGSLSFINTFAMIWNFLKFILTLMFAPIIIAYIIPSIPMAVVLLISLPNIIILTFGTISFIKGSDW